MIKKKILAAALAGFISFNAGQSIAGGIPVIDVSSIAQQITQVQHMITQIRELENQVRTAGEQLDNARGVRGMAGILNSAYDAAVEINQAAENQILQDAGIKSAETIEIKDQAFKNIYDERSKETAQALGKSQKTLQQAKDRFADLLPLINQINNSPDQKDIMDLSARIAAESVMLQNEMLKLEALKAEAEAQDRAYEQKIRQMAVESKGNSNVDYSGTFGTNFN